MSYSPRSHDNFLFVTMADKLCDFLSKNISYRMKSGRLFVPSIGFMDLYYAIEDNTGDIYNPANEVLSVSEIIYFND